MTSQQLIAEGRKLQRPCLFLRPQGPGQIAAIWHERDEDEIESTGFRCWLTVDTRQIPGFSTSAPSYLSIFSDEENCRGGRVEISSSWPPRAGVKLYAHPASVLPPIDAVFARGSEAVGEWIIAQGWTRTERYNDNFKDAALVEEYERVWQQEFPLYFESDIHAILGGWHFPMADDDWHELLDDQLLVLTIREAEPWIELWKPTMDDFHVIQRTT